jgi:hypothetical protein
MLNDKNKTGKNQTGRNVTDIFDIPPYKEIPKEMQPPKKLQSKPVKLNSRLNSNPKIYIENTDPNN